MAANFYQSVVRNDHPLAYYPLGAATTSTSAFDVSGNNRTATVHGGVTLSQPTLLPAGDAAATSLFFDGISGYISIPTSGFPTGAQPWGIEAWASPTILPTHNGAVIGFGTYTTHEMAELIAFNNGDTWGLSTYGGDIGFPTFVAKQTYYLAGTYDGTSTRLYLNGSLFSTGTFTLAIALAFASIGAGSTGPTDFFNGLIQHVAIYNYTLSASQIANHYNVGHTGAGGPLQDQYTGMGWQQAGHPYISIGGIRVQADDKSLLIDDSIGARSTADFQIDDTGIYPPFQYGQLVQIWSDGGQNLLTANQSNVETDTTGFIPSAGAVLTKSTFQAYQGANSLQVACAGGGSEGFYDQAPASSFLPSQPYTLSLWLYCASSISLIVQWVQLPPGGAPLVTLNSKTVQVPANQWTRYSLLVVTPATQLTGTCGIRVNINQAFTGNYYADGLQVEQDTTASDWHVGGTYGGTLKFAGVLLSAIRNRYGYGANYPVHIKCGDWHYLADKRIGATTYQFTTCGAMFRNLIDNYLAAEGVKYQRGVNLLSAQQSSADSALTGTDFLTVGTGTITLTQDTTPANVLQGSGSLKIVCDGTQNNQGFEARVTNANNNFPYGGSIVGSIWAKASAGSPTMFIFVSSSAGVQGTPLAITLSTSWQKFVICAQIPFPANETYFSIGIDTNGVQAVTFWADQMQMEIAAARSWAPGGSVGSYNQLTAEQADIESSVLTGIGIIGGGTVTVTQDTTTSWSGNASLKCVTDGTFAFQGTDMTIPNNGQFPIGSIITCSYWGKSTTAMSLYIALVGIGQGAAATQPAGTTWQRFQFTCQVTSAAPNPVHFQILTPTAQAGTFWVDGLQVEIGAAPTNWEVGSLQQTVFDGPTVLNYAVPYVPVSKAFDDLAQLATFYWYIDVNKLAWFQAPATVTAPFTYDGTQGVFGSQTIETNSPLYRNAQWLLNIPDVTAQQTESRKGDGASRSFIMSYPLNSAPTILVGGGQAGGTTVGIKGVDDVNHSKHWYWAPGDAVLTQEQNDPVLSATYQNLIASGATAGTFTLGYKGQTTAAINWNDSAATIQSKLTALSTIGGGNCVAYAGPLPNAYVGIAFVGALITDQTQLTVVSNALTGGTPVLSNPFPLQVQYVGRWISNVYSTNAHQVQLQSVIEGGTSGLVEEAHNDPSIQTSAQGFQLAAALLARYGVQGKELKFTTRVSTLVPGMMLNVTMLSSGWQMQNAQALIEQIQASIVGGWWVFTVTAIVGPFNQNWVQFFQRLAQVGSTVIGAAGSNQIVALLAAQTFAWSWTVSMTQTVFACPICAATLKCGPTVKVC